MEIFSPLLDAAAELLSEEGAVKAAALSIAAFVGILAQRFKLPAVVLTLVRTGGSWLFSFLAKKGIEWAKKRKAQPPPPAEPPAAP